MARVLTVNVARRACRRRGSRRGVCRRHGSRQWLAVDLPRVDGRAVDMARVSGFANDVAAILDVAHVNGLAVDAVHCRRRIALPFPSASCPSSPRGSIVVGAVSLSGWLVMWRRNGWG